MMEDNSKRIQNSLPKGRGIREIWTFNRNIINIGRLMTDNC